MRISMYAKFQILENNNGKFVLLNKDTVSSLSIGGYCFVVNGKSIPFDWDAFSGSEEDGVFEFETGYGWFNDFELTDCYDEEYQKLGISREDITAKFLASAERIEEFHINFEDANYEEVDLGYNDDEQYKIKLIEISFRNMETNKEYKVQQTVLNKYNKRS